MRLSLWPITFGSAIRYFAASHSVNRSDAAICFGLCRIDASLRLTRWLRAREGIRLADVIGHAESLSSPHHHERVASWRRLTHADFGPRTMRRYRRLVAGA